MTHAVNNIKNGVQDGLISVEDIDEKLIYGSTFTGSFENVDLLIRTSGECRLSDYLSWHVSDCTSSVIIVANDNHFFFFYRCGMQF